MVDASKLILPNKDLSYLVNNFGHASHCNLINTQHGLIFSMASQHQLAKNEFVKVWVTRLPSLSHAPLSMWRHRVTCRPPKNASAPWCGPGSRWLTSVVRQVSYIQYLLACQKSQRSTPYNIVKIVLAWSRVFRRRHLGRRVTAVTCLRWSTVTVVLCLAKIKFIPGMDNVLPPL